MRVVPAGIYNWMCVETCTLEKDTQRNIKDIIAFR